MRPGDRFGRYEIERQIGAGGMGVVHLALDTKLQRRVALKVMSPQLTGDEEFLARFDREAATLARLDSPHITTIFDHGVVDGTPFLAMQYVAGGDLGTQLKRRGPVPVQLAATICAQVAEALHDAHAAGIVHRDVKPANVLVRDPDATEPFVYLGDFGIAQAATGSDGLTRAGGVAGSWAYLAPERAHGAPATPASDVYALGCLLHACVTGRAPYVGSDVEMAVAHVNEPVPRLPGTDAATVELNRVLARAMAKDPAERHASAGELRSDLVALSRMPRAALSPGGATPEPGRSPLEEAGDTAPPARGRRTTAVVAAAALALVAVVGGTLAVRSFDGDDDGDASPDAATDGPAAIADPVAGDWDGDGLGDVRAARSVWRDGLEALPVVLLTSDGTALGEAVEDAGMIERPKVGDVDGDGRPDLVQVVESDDDTEVTATVWRGTGDGVEELSQQTFRWRTDYGFYGMGDFDGDGRDDLLLTRNRGEKLMVVSVARSAGDGFDEPVEYASRGGRANEDDQFAIGDFDGDGLDDLAARVVNGGGAVGVRFRVLLSTGERFRKSPTTRIEDGRYGVADYTAADIDGDGADELVHLITDRWGEDEYGATVAVQRFVNGGFGTPKELVAPTSGGPDFPYLDVAASDVDGDGDQDVVRLHAYDDDAGTALVEVYVSDGDSLQEPVEWGVVPCTTSGCEGEAASLVARE
ncbi:serine/threonine-protein kinase [Nocardioides sp. zg-1228]|uniref:serine/threonine-protein kinase n=1 Tax=Nocardioides sp. zg-1228 TaxID=2763008 RepID=UPI001642DAD5|nr:serine/threonine-protein kinase [Nocardioides sp. zg-1228]MBC2931733.1 serine/threonine protein kinase [Nocardioides sp. zg-1228]QSF57318.1 serine/threonine protein kinase [Nocardioides sp. zg-1228]